MYQCTLRFYRCNIYIHLETLIRRRPNRAFSLHTISTEDKPPLGSLSYLPKKALLTIYQSLCKLKH